MRKVILYIASSLDGYIARANGDVDWLDEFNGTGEDYGYYEFFESINVSLMGNTTYKQTLSFGEFPYKEKENYVFTHQKELLDAEYVTYINKDIISFVKNLKNQRGKDIWLIGGTKINEFFLNNMLVDTIILSIMPVTLGSGIPLFSKEVKPSKFKLVKQESYTNGVVQLHYFVLKD